MHQVEVTVNGVNRRAEVSPETTLLSVLRDSWALTGSKLGCDVGDCGACTVLVDGLSVNACLLLAVQVNGREVVTIEGLGGFEYLHPLQAAFERLSSYQCGFCAPGMIISAKALLDENPAPTEHEIREALSGNLCRCTGYTKVIDAITEVCRDRAGAVGIGESV
ncbi:MAG: (2Fe-2S)-binding protein [Acidimicrobiia bacterium]|nr:(2Fe-2S)-binding protein [Acidimicrobiia bacterium]MDH5616092.1 (2Fe-2S)-binding protein [Acidimicrobiia bacterium]